MLKLPLSLRLGRIGKLQLVVPWRSLSSSPVEILIKGVNLIICKKAYSCYIDYRSQVKGRLGTIRISAHQLRDEGIDD